MKIWCCPQASLISSLKFFLGSRKVKEKRVNYVVTLIVGIVVSLVMTTALRAQSPAPEPDAAQKRLKRARTDRRAQTGHGRSGA